MKRYKYYNLGNNAIMFGNTKICEYCKQQHHLLKQKFNSGNYLYKKVTMGKRLKNGMKINAIPTWYIPTGNGQGILHEGIIKDKKKLKTLLEKRNSSFGYVIPQIGTLTKYGKNFPDSQGFNTTDNFNTELAKIWKDPLLSGTLGREFGPGGTDNIYSNDYFNNMRMARPGGDLDTTLGLNKACNQFNPSPSPSGGNADPVTYSNGMIYNSPNPQITSFGRNLKKNLKKKLKKNVKKPLETINMYKSYINNERFKKGERVRCMGNTPMASLGGLSCDTFNNYSTNYKQLVPQWEEKIKKLTPKGSSFGNLYKQMGPVPSQNYLLTSKTFNEMYAGGGQGEPPRPVKGSNENYFINSAPPYIPVKSVTSFGKRQKVSFVKPKKEKQKKAGEGSILTIKDGKVKIN
jgi:hypothetical protein